MDTAPASELKVFYFVGMYNYFIIILNIDISSMIKKTFHHFCTVTLNCQVQGSHLMKSK